MRTPADQYAIGNPKKPWYADRQYQQYLAKDPFGYRCHANTGVKFPATA